MWELAYRFGQLAKLIEDRFGPKAPALGVAEASRRSRLFPGHVLYHFQLSPYSKKVRLRVRELGLPIPMREVLGDQEAWKELVSKGGKDQVPCLRIDEPGKPTRWMYESADIIRYLEAGVGEGSTGAA